VKLFLPLLALLALPALAAEPTLYGRYENIGLPELQQTLKAKMDTGAYTASLSARDIQLFSRDGDKWVRFRLAAKGADDTVYEHQLARMSKIKNRADEGDEDPSAADVSKRPVIDLQLCLGHQKRTVEVNLTDRSSFNYPLLIGAKALRELGAAINPGARFTAGKPNCD
jgi:hypothetical protein